MTSDQPYHSRRSRSRATLAPDPAGGGSETFLFELKSLKRHRDSPSSSSFVTSSSRLSASVASRSSSRPKEFDRVDYVLVWEEDLPDAAKSAAEVLNAKFRDKFVANLNCAGVHVDEVVSVSSKKRIHFVKLLISFEAMCHYAVKLQLRVPLQVLFQMDAGPSDQTAESTQEMEELPCSNWLSKGLFNQEVPNKPRQQMTGVFTTSNIARAIDSNRSDEYFTQTQRHMVAFEILGTQAYGSRERSEVGIERMIEEGIYTCAFPLHEGSVDLPSGEFAPSDLNQRQILFAYWARWHVWNKYQPIEHIRAYFGEKIAFYFAWLGMYTVWLIPPSILGFLIFLYGCFTTLTDVPVQETCSSNKTYKMCPDCDEKEGCNFWYLSEMCFFTWLSRLFDHPGIVIHASFVCFWAALFLEFWTRHSSWLAYRWGVMDYKDEEERPRPGYSVVCTQFRKNPVTGETEPHFPERKKLPRIAAGIGCILLMLSVVVIATISVILYRILISISLWHDQNLRSIAKNVASLSSAVIHLLVLYALEFVYEKMAYKLTQWEMHRTQAEFEDHLTAKVFIFEFFNYYSSVLYVAFIKGKFHGYPGNYTSLFGIRVEACDPSGCMVDLAIALVMIMTGKQVVNNIAESLLPMIRTWLHRFCKGLNGAGASGRGKTAWEADYELIPYDGLFSEYLEMALQFGFVTIFAAAFPLAPLFALLNNWLEIRIDARKLVCGTRRPLAERAHDIGVWFQLLGAIAKLSIVANAFLIAFTSDFLPKLIYHHHYRSDMRGYVNFTLSWSPPNATSQPCRYKDFRDQSGNFTSVYWTVLVAQLAFVIVFEHVIFLLSSIVQLLISDMPRKLRIRILREQFLAKQALLTAQLTHGKEDATLDEF